MESKVRSEERCHNQELLITYLYDEATSSERRSFEMHLDECASCRKELNALSSVRTTLGAWNLNFETAAPAMQIAIKRNSIETLRELIEALRSWPAWLRLTGAGALATCGLLLAFSLAGTQIDLTRGMVSFGVREVHLQSAPPQSIQQGAGRESLQLTKPEVEKIIAERIAAATASDRQKQEELSARVAGLSAQLANVTQSRVRVAAELAALRAEQRALAARGQATLGEWLFAANGSREPWGGNDERDN